MPRKIVFLFLLMLFFSPILQAVENKPAVITTLFPIYDFARQIGQDKISVTLLLPAGVEAHSYEPSAGDVVKVNKADIFIYISNLMEPWVEKFTSGVDNKKLVILAAGDGLADRDPHIWLDFSKAMAMVDRIRDALIARDPANRDFYLVSARQYNEKLASLDTEYRQTLSACRNKVLIFGGHFAFGYLAQRYHLLFLSAYKGFSPDAEPTPRNLAELVDKIRQYQVKYIFYEELLSPRVAEILSQETGAQLLQLSAAHNLSREEMDKGVSFIDVMKANLANLRQGLLCQ